MTNIYSAETYRRVLDDAMTEALIESQRRMPCAEVADELERRGVVLWHHALRRTV